MDVCPVSEESSMLSELSVVEQRYLAVREVLDTGATITDVASRYGVDRRTLHRWISRYANGGLEALATQSSRPDTSPSQMPPAIEARLVELRRAHPRWGPRTLTTKLRAQFAERAPSRSAIYRALVRHRLIVPIERRRTAESYKRWERTRSMELWQMDVVGRIYLTGGQSISCVTGIDDHSRFCVSAHLVERATAQQVCDALLAALRRHGVPKEILIDNGKVFTGKLAPKPSVVLFDRICANNGIKHRLTAPYSPTTTGKVERLHRTMREEFFDLQRFDTIAATQAALDAWVAEYNTTREHQSIGDLPPIRRFELALAPPLEVIDGDVSIETTPTQRGLHRRVDDKGRIGVLRFRYHVGRAYSGEAVEVTLDGGLLHVHHGDVLVATHAKRHLAEDDVKFTDQPPVARPTRGDEVLRMVDMAGVVSFAGTGYRAGNAHRGRQVGVRIVGDTVQITLDGHLLRTHKARHDKMKEFSALAQRKGKPRKHDVA
jgi:transposase InsO family protein